MTNCFEDVKRELVNGRQLAHNYDEFILKMTTAIQTALNSDEGQDFIQPAVDQMICSDMSQEAWNRTKANIMVMLFCMALDECPMLKHEMTRHLYHELRKEN